MKILLSEIDNKQKDLPISSVCTDSRKLKKGDLFIAIKGEFFDGNNFIRQAIEAGAIAVICDNENVFNQYVESFSAIPIILVENSVCAYGEIAKIWRNKLEAIFIGITGSVGKTTTKILIGNALSKVASTYIGEANFNNFIGVPYNILNIKEDHKFSVIEMGMQWAGEIDYLSSILEPDIAIICNVSQVHLEFFEDGLLGIAKAKSEIFNYLREGGKVILNTDMDHFDEVYKAALKKTDKENICTYGMSELSDIRLIKYEILHNTKGANVYFSYKGMEYKISLCLGSISLIVNSMCVIALFSILKIDIDIARIALRTLDLSLLEGRGRLIEVKNNIILLDECYNAGYISVVGVLKNLVNLFKDRRKVVIIGQMHELGPESSKLHASLHEHCNDIDIVITIGAEDNIHSLTSLLQKSHEERHKHFNKVDEFIAVIDDFIMPGDATLVKGANSLGLNKLIEHMKNR